MGKHRQLSLFEDSDETAVGRQAHDFYPTDARLTRKLFEFEEIAGVVGELCVGDGDMARVIEAQPGVASVVTNDIDPTRLADFHGDAGLMAARIYSQRVDWFVTNPPFSEAHRILPAAMAWAEVGVAFLLRLSYLEPTMSRNTRGDWLKAHADMMTRLITFGDPRPNFPPYDKKTDSVTTSWFVWRRDWSWAKLGIAPPFAFVSGWKRDHLP